MTIDARSVTRRISDIAEEEGESPTRVSLRDALLPKLISGEVRVKDAEKFIGRAVGRRGGRGPHSTRAA